MADDLAASGLRLHAGTVYITSVSDVRLPYPQMEIVDTSQGGAGPSGSAGAAQAQANVAAIDQEIADISAPTRGLRPKGAEELRAKRGISDQPRSKR